MTSATDGLQPFASWTKSDQHLPYWKTSQGCLALGMDTLDKYSETWPRSGIMQSGTASQLQPSAHRIVETGSGYLRIPTPTAGDAKSSGSRNLEGSKANHGVSLTDLVKTGDSTTPRQVVFPTPQTSQWPNEGNMRLMRKLVIEGKVSREEAGQMAGKDPFAAQGKLKAMTWPTPTTQDAANNGGPSQHHRNSKPLNAAVGGKLNPAWVAWLMAWPIGWTNLKPLAMDKWQAWCRSHGIRYAERQDSNDL